MTKFYFTTTILRKFESMTNCTPVTTAVVGLHYVMCLSNTHIVRKKDQNSKKE